MRLIDTHCHLNFPDRFPDPQTVIAEASAAGVDRVIVVGCDLESSERAVDLTSDNENVFAVVGWHPTYTAHYTSNSLTTLTEWLGRERVVALGEIGLDYHWDTATKQQQMVALSDQLDLAEHIEAPVVFHCREAYDDLLDILSQRVRPGKFLFHCFSGTLDDARRAMDMDAYFGVDGPITYKNAENLRQILLNIPRDRVVLETDSPFMPPEPHRGKPNRPAWTTFVNQRLAGLWNVSPEASATITTQNAENFFGLSSR